MALCFTKGGTGAGERSAKVMKGDGGKKKQNVFLFSGVLLDAGQEKNRVGAIFTAPMFSNTNYVFVGHHPPSVPLYSPSRRGHVSFHYRVSSVAVMLSIDSSTFCVLLSATLESFSVSCVVHDWRHHAQENGAYSVFGVHRGF